MSRPPEPAPPKAAEKPAETPKKNRSMTRKAFGELLKRVITKYMMILALPILSLLLGLGIMVWNKRRLEQLKVIYQGI